MYDWLKFLHILFAMVWVGGSIWVGFFGMRAARSQDPGRGKAFAADMIIGGRVLAVAGVLVFVFGAWMVIDQAIWEWEQFFIALGVAAVVIGAVLGSAFFGPQAEKTVGEFEAGETAAAWARMDRIAKVSQVELVLLLVVVFSMVAKWGV